MDLKCLCTQHPQTQTPAVCTVLGQRVELLFILLELTLTNQINSHYMYYVVSNSNIPLHRESVLARLRRSNLERLRGQHPPNINDKYCHYAVLHFCDTIHILYSYTEKLVMMLLCVFFHVGTTNMSSMSLPYEEKNSNFESRQ